DLNERYVREWLRGMTAAGYLDYEPATELFSLPVEHAPVLVQETGPVFFGGVYQELIGALAAMERVADAFRAGGGAPQEAYPSDLWDGMERFSAGWFENLLLSEWLPAAPQVCAKLEQGAKVADVGCGAGRALVKLAGAFPNSRCSGFDAFEGQIDRARQNAAAAGLGDRVTFERRDVATDGLPERFDLITTFDVVHDAVDPLALLKAIRAGLAPGGTYLVLEINCADHAHDNQGPIAQVLYGFSLLYCMTSSLAHDGAGLGTCGLPESRIRALATKAGFGSVTRVAENPFNVLYALTN
ncbi:MAG TPA: methyltransferase domain-containing protein, partial [Solirubrobacteraceae bacterium]|nr:methyltransferase domain-containing protein [Solirubrobacteraceae bacterium]